MEFVSVAVRIKPPPISCQQNKCLEIINTVVPVLSIIGRHQSYAFDRIFDESADQNEIFTTLIGPLIDKAVLGYNGTIFAYGQTGTGKTYTMGSDMKELTGEHVGIIKRVCDAVLAKASTSRNIDIEMSVCEIYQEKVYDLLGNNNTAVCVRGINNFSLTQEKIIDQKSAEKLLVKSSKRRHTSGTKQNMYSSRSHAVFTVHINVHNEDGIRCSKLNLVDLAGCESVKKTNTKDYQFNEAIKINMSLLSVRLVINALSSGKTCIPYRESMLTRILHDSLNKRSYVTLIACVSADGADINGTIQTLEFAIRTKKVKSKPEMNSVLGDCYATGYGMKTPRKRANPYMKTSTTIKRSNIIPQTFATVSKKCQKNSFLYSTIVSPIAKTIINKLENRYGYNLQFSAKKTQFYDVMRTLIKEEVQQHSTNTGECIDQENDIINEVSLIIDSSSNELDLSGIAPFKQNEQVINGVKKLVTNIENRVSDGRSILSVVDQENKSTETTLEKPQSYIIDTNGNREDKDDDETITKEIVEKGISFIGSSNNKHDRWNQENIVVNANISSGTSGTTVAEENSLNSRSRLQLFPDINEKVSFTDDEIKGIQISSQYRRSVRLSLKTNYSKTFEENKENCQPIKITKDCASPKNTSSTSNFKVPDINNFRRNTIAKVELFAPRRSRRLSMKKDAICSDINLGNKTSDFEFTYPNVPQIKRNNVRRSIRIAQSQYKSPCICEHISNEDRREMKTAYGVPNKHCDNFSLDSWSKCSSILQLKSNSIDMRASISESSSLSKNKHTFSLKKGNKYVNLQLNDSSILEVKNDSKEVIDTSQEDVFEQSNFKTFPVFAQRRSIRLSMKNTRFITSSPNDLSLTMRKSHKRSTHGKQLQNIEIHKNSILRKLNRGNLKELQKLHTIGAKTAEQILLFRKLNGSFKDIEDVKQILYRGKSYDRFLTSNCLNIHKETIE